METKPKNKTTPTRIDTTLSQAMLNLSLAVPGAFVLYLLSCNISENKQFTQELKLADKEFSIESLRIVTPKPYDSIILRNKFEQESFANKLEKSIINQQLLEMDNKLKDVKIDLLKENPVKVNIIKK